MNKRTAIISLIVLLSGVIIIGYFLYLNRKDLVTDPYKVIGTDAAIIVETYDLQNLINSVTAGKGLFGELSKVDAFDRFNRELHFLADQINKPGYKKIMQEGTVLVSFHRSGKGRLIPFLSKTIPSEVGLRQIKECFESTGPSGLQEIKLNGKRIFLIPFSSDEQRDTLFVTSSSGLLIASTSQDLIARSVSQSGTDTDIRNRSDFSRILVSTGKNEDKLYVVFDNLRDVVLKFFAKDNSTVVTRISEMSGSAGGDFFIKENGVTLSGYSEVSDSSRAILRSGNIQPSEFQTYKVLPSATTLFKTTLFITEARTERTKPASVRILNLADELLPYIGDEITEAYINIRDNPSGNNSIMLFRLKNRVQCESIILRHLGDNPGIAYFRPDDQTRVPVYTDGIRGLGSVLIPGFADNFTDACFTFFDNYLVTGNSVATLSRFLYDNMLNKTLANDVYYREFENMVPSRTGFLFYCVPSGCVDFLAGYLDKKLIDGLRENMGSLNKIESVGFQLASINGMIYNNLSVSYRDEAREQSVTEWETLLDTTAAIKPFFFKNHNTGAKEIFIQDTRNNAYLINAAGRVLWKVPLKERINGSVYMIDYYHNGKYQLLFSGKNNLHLIDRNGNYVERYPVRLRSPATSPLALFDYDNNQNYRLIISGEDKLVYTYDKAGSVVKGWEPFRTAGIVNAEAGYFKVSGKDYIVIADESSVYFLDRFGKQRLRLNDAAVKARGSALRLVPGSDPALVCTSPDGTIQTISFNGNVRKSSIRKFSFDHSFDFFDVDSDGFGEYIFIDNGILYLYNHNLKEMFSKDFGSDMLGGPINFTFSSQNKKIGVFDINKNLIYLIDSKGKIMNGFPLRGASMFSIGKLGPGNDWNLIVGGTDRFLYNYKLEMTN